MVVFSTFAVATSRIAWAVDGDDGLLRALPAEPGAGGLAATLDGQPSGTSQLLGEPASQSAEDAASPDEGSGTVETLAATRTVHLYHHRNQTEARKLLNLVNQDRANNGRAALAWNTNLENLAIQRAAEISLYYSHTRPDGSSCFDIWGGNVKVRWWAENIGAGYVDANAANRGWIESPGHHASRTDSRVISYGAGCCKGEDGRYYWCELFSAAAGTGMNGSPDDGYVYYDDMPISTDRVQGISFPKARTGLVYTGSSQTGVPGGTGYRVSNGTGTRPGSYTATVSIAPDWYAPRGYFWTDTGSNATRDVSWSIAYQMVADPEPIAGLVYNGSPQTGVAGGKGYRLSGTVRATNAGLYTAYADLLTGYRWEDGSLSRKGITWGIERQRVSFNPSLASFTMDVVDSARTIATGLDSSVRFTAVSSAPEVATVTALPNGSVSVSPKSPGTATITLSVSDTTNYEFTSREFTVTVSGALRLPSSVTLSRSSLSLVAGDEAATVTVGGEGDGALRVHVANPSVARVSLRGSLLYVTPVGPGSTTVTVTRSATDAFEGSDAKLQVSVTSGEMPTGERVAVYRLYNPYSSSGEHHYTTDARERAVMVRGGWRDEGVAWYAPKTSGTAVYRLYNPYNGDHHYTVSLSEYQTLQRAGWSPEGVAWYSDDNHGVPVYRLYNRFAKSAGSHHYTTSFDEYSSLWGKGWSGEGVCWYGATPPSR